MSSRLTGSSLRWWVWCSAFGTLGGVLLLGGLTAVRAGVYAWLVGFGGEMFPWFWPVVTVLFLLSLAMMASVLSSDNFSDGSWDGGFKGMIRAVAEYEGRNTCDEHGYSISLRQLPACGIFTGGLLGLLSLMLGLSTQVVPQELDTVSLLLREEAQLDRGVAPALEQLPGGTFGPLDASLLLTGDGKKQSPLFDAFGNAITYERSKLDPREPYTLRSFGLDGKWSSDDLCVYGHTQDLPVGGRSSDADDFQRAWRAGKLTWGERAAVLEQMRCNVARRSRLNRQVSSR